MGGRDKEDDEILFRRFIRSAALAAALLALVGAPAVRAAGEPSATTPSIQIEVVEPDGFHWLDAAVGSLAATGLALVVVGVLLVSRRRDADPTSAGPDRPG